MNIVASTNKLVTAEELAKELSLPSAYSVRSLARQRKIPVIKLGYRTHRYDLEKCRAALEKREQKAL